MPDRVKEKLVELIFGSLCRHIHKSCKLAENIADDLIAHGVTVQDSKGVEIDQFKKWIPVTERLPESQKTVLVSVRDKTFGHRHTLMAAHIGHHEAKTEDYGWQEYEGDTEYDEENDCFWIPECWWESNFVEDNTNWIIDSDYEVTHWTPLPEPPKGE